MNQETSLVSIDTIFVPQGAEYQAVCRGLKQNSVQVFPIPVGMKAVKLYLKQWQQTLDFLNKPTRNVLLMGLGGSLSPDYGIGEVVLYQGCGYETHWQNCDDILTKQLYERLKGKGRVQGHRPYRAIPPRLPLVRGITCDRVISSAVEKYQLKERFQVDVVDMEGFAILENFNQSGIPVSIIRVISDDFQQNLPDLTAAFGEDGQLKPWVLASKMLQQPLAAMRLIQSSLRGLRRLQEVAGEI